MMAMMSTVKMGKQLEHDCRGRVSVGGKQAQQEISNLTQRQMADTFTPNHFYAPHCECWLAMLSLPI